MKKIESFSLPVIHEGQIPLAFLHTSEPHKKGVVLAADVGGTKTDLALFKIKDGELILLKENSYPTKTHKSFVEIVHKFQNGDLPSIDGVCLGVAGPITQGKVHGTNFPWDIDSEEISKELHIPSISLINDMEANAYGLAALQEKDFETLKYGPNIPGNAALISPGTGLGEAGLFWDGSHYHPFATEGGHCDFSPRNDSDIEIWQYLLQKYGHVSWERLISGPGIYDIYLLLRRVSGEKEPQWLKGKMAKDDPSAVITETALENNDSVCVETLELFIRFLAIEAAQLALKFKATGGVYIGGGILPKIIKRMNREIFYGNFVQSGRLNSLLQMVPVKVILNEKTALLGAAYYGATALIKE
ncbi:glucokinase [Pricia antarctica]|uniref:Glucokinase n=1 Tax=Pricia antarctica TaxID=641691 RepID=A0A1G7CX36_9FLAO|nr:glucokinase [Pricia antarctica]SDE43350.1 glucokinase [Pricia antarctica]